MIQRCAFVLLIFPALFLTLPQARRPLTNNEIISMVRLGVGDPVIIQAIQSSETAFDISPEGRARLGQAGVSEGIITAMIAAEGRANAQKLVQGRGRSSSTGYYINGELRDAAGNLVPGAPVCVRETRGRKCSPTDSGGRFVLNVGGEGRYEIMPGDLPIRPSRDTFALMDAYPAVPSGSEVTLDSTHREANIVLTLPERNPELLLKVVEDTTQLPVELLLIELCYANQLLRCSGELLRSDTGEYKFHSPSKDFDLSVRAPDYEEWTSVGNKAMKPGSTQSIRIAMRRWPAAAGEALHESEKRVGIHLHAPVQLAPAENARLLAFPRTTTLQWEKVEGASRYEVEVDYCQISSDSEPCFRPTPFIFAFPSLADRSRPSTTADTSLTFDFIGSQPGRWRVWAMDKDGRRGFKSPWRTFTYAR